MRVSYHTFLFLNDVDIPIGDGNKKVESWLHLFAQSIESIKSWSDDYEVDIFVHSDTELDEFLSHDFVPRYGGGIGVTRMISAMKRAGLLVKNDQE